MQLPSLCVQSTEVRLSQEPAAKPHHQPSSVFVLQVKDMFASQRPCWVTQSLEMPVV